MPDLDAQTLADQAVMLGLLTRAQAREAVGDADDGTVAAVSRSLLRKGLLTSWQLHRLQKEKADPTGFFYGNCKVLFHLAEGTFARVFRGVDQDNDTPVAVKVLRNRFISDRAAVERFHQEAEAGMKLRHPNIVQILDYGETDKRHYMTMEYVEGANLREFLKIRQRITPDQALPLMLGLVRGMKYSVDRGVTHRDIKATNILISNTGQAKLVDFGLAGIQGAGGQSSAMQSQRTVDYSALERTCGSEKGDPRSDIYFLGCVFYHMITGQVPMKEAESEDMLQKMLKRSFSAIVPLGEHRLAPDQELAQIVEKMMQVKLQARYQTLGEVLNDLDAYVARAKTGISGLETAGEEEEIDFENFEELFLRRPGADDAEPNSPAFTLPHDPSGAGAGAGAGAEAGAEAAGEESDGPAPPAPPRERRNLLCVEPQAEIQEAFRKTLTRMGYRVVLVGDAELAAERFRESPPDGLIFDIDGLGAEAVDAFVEIYDRAADDGRPVHALVLLGPRQGALKARLPVAEGVVVLSKPVKMKQVQKAILQLIPTGK